MPARDFLSSLEVGEEPPHQSHDSALEAPPREGLAAKAGLASLPGLPCTPTHSFRDYETFLRLSQALILGQEFQSKTTTISRLGSRLHPTSTSFRQPHPAPPKGSWPERSSYNLSNTLERQGSLQIHPSQLTLTHQGSFHNPKINVQRVILSLYPSIPLPHQKK